MTRPGIEPRSPVPLANTLTPRPMSSVCVCVCVLIVDTNHQGQVNLLMNV